MRAQRCTVVSIFEINGVHRRPRMREQDTGNEVGRPMFDEGKAVLPCEHCFDEPEVVHLEVDDETRIPCEGRDDEWVQMEGRHAERDPEVFRPQQVECFGCPVRVACFEKAIREKPRYGVWGGTTPAQRAAWGDRADEIVIRRLRNGQEVKPYGGPGKKPTAYQPSLEGIG